MTTVTMPLAEMVEDMSIYPRHAVDDSNVSRLVLAHKAGAQLPPPVIDERSKRIIDGWHRIRMYRRVLGDNASIEVETRDYASEAEMVLDAVTLNAVHGRALDRIDQVRVVLLCQQAGIEKVAIAAALHIPTDRVEKLQVRVAQAPKSRTGAATGTDSIALKRPVAHMAGKKLTEQQARVHISLPGTSFLLIARQLSDACSAEMVNREDAKVMAALSALHDTLGAFLEK